MSVSEREKIILDVSKELLTLQFCSFLGSIASLFLTLAAIGFPYPLFLTASLLLELSILLLPLALSMESKLKLFVKQDKIMRLFFIMVLATASFFSNSALWTMYKVMIHRKRVDDGPPIKQYVRRLVQSTFASGIIVIAEIFLLLDTTNVINPYINLGSWRTINTVTISLSFLYSLWVTFKFLSYNSLWYQFPRFYDIRSESGMIEIQHHVRKGKLRNTFEKWILPLFIILSVCSIEKSNDTFRLVRVFFAINYGFLLACLVWMKQVSTYASVYYATFVERFSETTENKSFKKRLYDWFFYK